MKKNLRTLLLLAAAIWTVSSCDDDDPKVPAFTDEPCAVVVNQGAMGYLSGTLDLLSLTDGTYTTGYAELGGTPENVVECGGYLFIPLNEENSIAVYDKSSLLRSATIAVPAPQSICTDGARVFAVGNDSIFRISATTLAVEAKDTVGHTAFACTYTGGSVYVNVGRTYGQYTGGTTVAKVNPETLAVQQIEVGINPYSQIATDGSGNVYTVCQGNYYDVLPTVYRIASDGTSTPICNGTLIDCYGGKLYVAYRTSSYDEAWNEISTTTYKTYALGSATPVAEDFISAAAEAPAAATFLRVNPENGEVFIGTNGVTDGGFVSYLTSGHVYRYAPTGALLAKYDAGVSPYAIAFVTRHRVAE
ncbi:MAG: hypothetical protein J6M53_08330 [Bacteroidaceae bacterium]|nr:hypothetical protein [Bacteroidaceae bacterium]